MRVFNIPNTLTVLRIIVIPLFVDAIMYSKYRYALYLFIFAAFTDLLDGFLARLTNQKTSLGTFLDPLADKFLLVTSFILFAIYEWIPAWLAITVISRDLIVVVGWMLLYLLTHKSDVEPVFLGKLAIMFQMLILAYVLLHINVNSIPALPPVFLFITAFLSAASGLQYVYKGFKLTHEL